MDNKSQLLLVIFISLVFAVVSFSFYKYYVLSDYYIVFEVDCAPDIERCFIYECDPELDAECPDSVEDRISYYKLIKKKAYDVPSCVDPADCAPLACARGEDCEEIICDESTKSDEDICSDPQEYQINLGDGVDGITDSQLQLDAEAENGISGDGIE